MDFPFCQSSSGAQTDLESTFSLVCLGGYWVGRASLRFSLYFMGLVGLLRKRVGSYKAGLLTTSLPSTAVANQRYLIIYRLGCLVFWVKFKITSKGLSWTEFIRMYNLLYFWCKAMKAKSVPHCAFGLFQRTCSSSITDLLYHHPAKMYLLCTF